MPPFPFGATIEGEGKPTLPQNPINSDSSESKDQSVNHEEGSNANKTRPATQSKAEIDARGAELPVVADFLNNEKTRKYMKIIDAYKKLEIGGDIQLPRLVIAGVQSCGKSSLLENLTGLPVPITTGIGTRFPIEITLSEGPQEFVTTSIVHDPKTKDSSPLNMKDVEQFRKTHVYDKRMTQKQFKKLLQDASAVLGVPSPIFAYDPIPDSKSTDVSKLISRHVLQLNMSGPEFKSLSFVDTPGLYLSANRDQNRKSADDIDSLVLSLIEENRTIIIAVMEASQPTVAQKIFDFVNDLDVHGGRTLGVLTKCDDAPTDADALQSILRRARNEDVPLKHGWYLVKNRSSSEAKRNVSLADAKRMETKLFSNNAWKPSNSRIPAERLGIDGLRAGLSNVYCAHIGTEFPLLKEQTLAMLHEKQRQLVGLGPTRSTATEQRDYLKSLIGVYQTWSRHCRKEDFRKGDDPQEADVPISRRLAMHKKVDLRDKLNSSGGVWKFQIATADRDEASDRAASALLNDKTTNIYTWINDRYQKTNSAAVPGIVPYLLIQKLFDEQTQNWADITSDFLGSVEKVFTSAVEFCLKKACQNKLIRNGLKEVIFAEIRSRMSNLKTHCIEVTRAERDGLEVIACEEQYIGEVRDARTLRIISALASLLEDEKQDFYVTRINSTGPNLLGGAYNADQKVSCKAFLTYARDNKDKLKHVLTNDRQIVYEIHDVLKAYYSTSVQHYTDLVCKNGLNTDFEAGIMGIFSMEFIKNLSEAEINRIAAENPSDRKARRELKEIIERLTAAIEESEAILNGAEEML